MSLVEGLIIMPMKRAMSKADKAIQRKLMKGKKVTMIDRHTGQKVVIDGKLYKQNQQSNSSAEAFLRDGSWACQIEWACWVLYRVWSSNALPSQLALLFTLASPAIAFVARFILGVLSPPILTRDGRRYAKHGANQWFVVFLLFACTSEATRICWWLGNFGSVKADRFYGHGISGTTDVLLQAFIPLLFGAIGSTIAIIIVFQTMPYGRFMYWAIWTNICVTALYVVIGIVSWLFSSGSSAAAAVAATTLELGAEGIEL